VTGKVAAWFGASTHEAVAAARAATGAPPVARTPGLDARALSVGLLLTGPPSAFAKAGGVPPEVALTAAALARTLVGAGGSLVLPSSSPLLKSPLFTDEVVPLSRAGAGVGGADDDSEGGPFSVPSLAFGQSLQLPPTSSYDGSSAAAAGATATATVEPGLHVMDMPSVRDWSETVTGLAAAGCHVVLALTVEQQPTAGGAQHVVAPGHPLVPVLHVGLAPSADAPPSKALAAATDAVLAPPAAGSPVEDTVTAWLGSVLRLLAEVAGGGRRVKAADAVFFSVTRGHVGVST
jgi:hypothetical protein